MLSCTKGGAKRAAVGFGGYGTSLAVAPKTYLGHTGLVRSLEPHPYNNKCVVHVAGVAESVAPHNATTPALQVLSLGWRLDITAVEHSVRGTRAHPWAFSVDGHRGTMEPIPGRCVVCQPPRRHD